MLPHLKNLILTTAPRKSWSCRYYKYYKYTNIQIKIIYLSKKIIPLLNWIQIWTYKNFDNLLHRDANLLSHFDKNSYNFQIIWQNSVKPQHYDMAWITYKV